MKLYEINEKILELTEQIQFDDETGEMVGDIDSITAELEGLEIERQSALEYIAKVVLNTRAETAALKAEEQRLKARRQTLEKKESRLIDILDRECRGQKTDFGVATFNYRKVKRVDITDKDAALMWLQNNHEDCIKYAEPEISKAEIKKILAAGEEIPGATLISDVSCSLR